MLWWDFRPSLADRFWPLCARTLCILSRNDPADAFYGIVDAHRFFPGFVCGNQCHEEFQLWPLVTNAPTKYIIYFMKLDFLYIIYYVWIGNSGIRSFTSKLSSWCGFSSVHYQNKFWKTHFHRLMKKITTEGKAIRIEFTLEE